MWLCTQQRVMKVSVVKAWVRFRLHLSSGDRRGWSWLISVRYTELLLLFVPHTKVLNQLSFPIEVYFAE